VWGDTLEGSDTRVKAIKSDSDSDSDEQKRSPSFSGKNKGVTPSVAAPGVIHPSDATGCKDWVCFSPVNRVIGKIVSKLTIMCYHRHRYVILW